MQPAMEISSPQTGAPFASLADAETRSSTMALVWRIAGINWDLFEEWKRTRPEAFAALRGSISKVAGFRVMPLPTNSNEMCWINNWHAERTVPRSRIKPRPRWRPAPVCGRCWPI